MLAISTIKEAELLLSVSGIVGGIDIEQDLSPFADLFAADLHKPIQQRVALELLVLNELIWK